MAYNGTDPTTDGIHDGLDCRRQRGMEIAAVARIDRRETDIFLVPSVTSAVPTQYRVKLNLASGGDATCNCPDHEMRGCKCKHIYAVEFYLRRELNPDGSTTVTESVTVTHTRKTYPQNWPAYNEAQTHEKRDFQVPLRDLCKDLPPLPVPADRKTKRGRPPLPVSDSVFAAVFKVYSTMSARRFVSDLCDAQAKGYIGSVPHFNSVLNYLENPDLFPVLTSMIQRASLPLSGVESDFAVDSTGFTSCRFVRWYDVKYNRFTSEQQWVKAHICTGVKTNVVTAIEIHGRDAGDAPILPSLVESTAKGFNIKEVSGDKGYSSRDNHDAIERVGGTPFIAFKTSASGKSGGLFGKMFHYFQFQRDDFLAHYHKRSNVESTVMMIKSKFGDSLRSKTDAAMRNETLCKVLCHNICCLTSAVYELGIQPTFEAMAGLPA